MNATDALRRTRGTRRSGQGGMPFWVRSRLNWSMGLKYSLEDMKVYNFH
jgi:hypothetical protein